LLLAVGLLFQREEAAQVADMPHTTMATARLRFLFLAAKIWQHAGPAPTRIGVNLGRQLDPTSSLRA
jgi:hypothetical protein